jgi:ubiquinone/menaquinone biosynthesis C-methylase UbiE
MNHADHVALIRDGAPTFEGVWADLGAGTGAFTLALADLMGDRGRIIAVDQDDRALRENARRMAASFPHVEASFQVGNFARDLNLPPLDGIIMANSLHFHRDKGPILDRVRAMLRPGGRLILVEYNVDRGNMWVPHPISFETWRTLAEAHAFRETRLLHRRPSSFLREIYSAGSLAPDQEVSS